MENEICCEEKSAICAPVQICVSMTSDKCKRSLWCGLLRELFDHWATLQLIHSILSMLLMAILFPIIVNVSPGQKFGIWRKKTAAKEYDLLENSIELSWRSIVGFWSSDWVWWSFEAFFHNDNLWHLLKSLAKLIRRSLVLKSWSTPTPTLVCSLEHTMIKTRKIRIHVDSVHSSQLWCDRQWKMSGIIARMIAIHTEWSRWGRSAFMLTPSTLLSEESSKSRHNANHWRRQVEIFALCSSSWFREGSGYQIGWIFVKIPNGLHPPLLPTRHFRKIMLQFFMTDMVAYMPGGMMAR